MLKQVFSVLESRDEEEKERLADEADKEEAERYAEKADWEILQEKYR